MLQIIVQVAIKAARPTMDASTPEPLKRLIAKCWAQVCSFSRLMLHHQAAFHACATRFLPGRLNWHYALFLIASASAMKTATPVIQAATASRIPSPSSTILASYEDYGHKPSAAMEQVQAPPIEYVPSSHANPHLGCCWLAGSMSASQVL